MDTYGNLSMSSWVLYEHYDQFVSVLSHYMLNLYKLNDVYNMYCRLLN